MKKLTFLILSISPLLVFASGVYGGYYIGADIGATNRILHFKDPYPGQLDLHGSQLYTSKFGLSTRLDVGYNLNPHSGVEVGYGYFGETKSNYPHGGAWATSTNSVDISWLPYFPIAQSDFSLFGRVGLAYNSISIKTSSDTLSRSSSSSGLAEELGLGVLYTYNPSIAFRLSWSENGLLFPVNINDGDKNIARWTAQSFQLGVSYKF